MSRSWAAIAVISAVSIGAFLSQKLTGDPVDQPTKILAQAGDDSPEGLEQPRAKSGPKRGDVPLTHAILREEKEDAAESQILDALGKPTTVEFLDLPLEDAITFLKEFHGINIYIDKSTLTDEGVALDQPVTLKLAGLRLESILNLLLQPVQLDWVIADEVLKITTRAWADAHPEVRTYDIQNLIEAGHTPEDLILSITHCVEPSSWNGKDPTNGISHSGGVLIVRQSQRNHGEIAHLLEDLDAIADADEENGAKAARNAVVSVRVYQTGGQPAEKLAECLQDFVESKSWLNRGGSGKVRPLAGALVVEQSAGVHQSIQQFLSKLLPRSPALPATIDPGNPPAPAGGAAASASNDPFGVLNRAGRPNAPMKAKQPGFF
jgi:hypothetical protein